MSKHQLLLKNALAPTTGQMASDSNLSPEFPVKNWTPEQGEIYQLMALVKQPISSQELRARIQEIPGLDVNALDYSGHCRLASAAALCTVEHLQVLKDLGANFKLLNVNQVSLMHVAASEEVVHWLSSQGVGTCGKALGGDAPLHSRAAYNSRFCVRALLALGADVNAKNDKGQTPLHVVMRSHQAVNTAMDAIQLLVSAGANLHAKDKQGWTPLHEYTHANEFQIIHKLITAGANPEVTDDWGLRAIHLAIKKDHSQCIFMLNALGASMLGTFSNKSTLDGFLHESRLLSAARTGKPEVMLSHLKLFPNPDSKALEASNKLLKLKCYGDVQGVLQAHLAAQAIESVLGSASLRTAAPRAQ